MTLQGAPTTVGDLDRPVVVVVGLGPAGEDLLTSATVSAVGSAPVRFVRTWRHPAATLLETSVGGGAATKSFDEVYESSETLEEVYSTIVERLVEAAAEAGEVLYAVPGSPLVAEHTVELLLADPRVETRVVPALSFLDLAWVRLGVDPLAAGVRIVDGHRFSTEAAGERGPLLVAQCDTAQVLSDVKLAIGDAVDGAPVGAAEPVVTVIQRLGLPDEVITRVDWHELDRVDADHLTSLWIPELAVPVASALQDAVEVVSRLRAECPWDRSQTHRSLRRHLLEEAYEVLEVLDSIPDPADNGAPGDAGEDGDAGGSGPVADPADAASPVGDVDGAYLDLEEELGDLLFQVLLHAAIATEAGRFTMADVATGIAEKLRSRHPHVFGDAEVGTPEEQAVAWEQAKLAEKGRGSVFDGIPDALPSLLFALKVQKKAATLSRSDDLPEIAPLLEAARAVQAGIDAGVAAGEGAVVDLLLSVVDAARRSGVDPENALRAGAVAWRDRARSAET